MIKRYKTWQKLLLGSGVLLGSAVLTLAVLSLVIPGIFNSNKATDTAQADRADQTKEEPAPAPKPSPVLTAVPALQTIIDEHPQYRISVTLQDISTNDQKTYGDTEVFTAASTGKLITAAAYYHQVEIGSASLDTIVGGAPASLQIERMINQSNNDSWYALEIKLGLATINSYAASIGVDYTITSSGKTITSASMATFLSNLYNGKIINSEHTQQLFSFMQNTNNETLIAAVTPKDVTLYHKYGWLGPELHDVAILKKGDKVYALTIYTESIASVTLDDYTKTIQSLANAAIEHLFSEE